MATHERYGKDDITETRPGTTFRLDRPMSKAEGAAIVAAMNLAKINSSFELRIRALEPELKQEVARSPMAKYGSRAYYARELLDAIAEVRTLRELKSPSGIDAALAAAMRVGFLAAECWAKHAWAVVGMGVRKRRDSREKGRGGGITKGENAKRRHDPDILRYYKLWNDSDDLRYEFRSVISYINSKTGIPKSTIRDRLKVLKPHG